MHQRTLVVAVLLATLAAPALAQTGPDLLIEKFDDKPHWADSLDEPTVIAGGDEEESGEPVDIFYWDSKGRVKFDRPNPDPSAWFGYRVLAVTVDSEIDDFPRDLWDIAVVSAFKLGEDDTWRTSIFAGAGTANDAHFSNSDSIYALADFNAERKIDADTSLHLGVNFDGNRNLWPDLPLPYIQYVRDFNGTLGFALGVPRSAVAWRPLEPLVLKAEYTVPSGLDANASWYFNERFSLFGEYRKTTDGFYIHDADDQRLFYEWQRVAGGVRFITDWIDARIGIGWAFDQEFSSGWDVRDTNSVAEPGDGMVYFFTLKGTF